jgi:hypothetical protein
MGGRGSTSGGDSRQLTLEWIQRRKEIQAIMAESEAIRASQAGELGRGASGRDSRRLLQCACCEQYSLQPEIENEQCPVCGWINDRNQNDHPDSLAGNNPISLNQARRQWNGHRGWR